MKNENVNIAGKNLSSANTAKHDFVQEVVPTNSLPDCHNYVKIKKIKAMGFDDVYNLEVPSVHNFAVNGGLIVHNCIDSLRYATESLMREPIDIHSAKHTLF